MRVLIVEDESHVAAELQEALGSLIPRIDTVTVGSLSGGIEVLRSDEFDLIVCDLKIPPREGGIDAYEEHGLAVHEEARTVCPGTPCLFFTGLTTSQAIVERLSSGATRDILGTGEEYEMTQLLPKDQLVICVERIESFNIELATLDAINIHLLGNEFPLDDIEQRALRLLARPLGGKNIEASGLGGLSGAQTLKANVKDDQGRTLATYFVKIDSRTNMEKERQNNNLYVNPLLRMGSYPTLIRVIEAGIGTREALVYQLANEYTESMFDVLALSESAAIDIVEVLRTIFAPWSNLTEKKILRIRELRAQRINDSVFRPYRDALGPTEQFEEIEQELETSCQHGDLHGSNILCDGSGNAAVIDFGNVGHAPSCIDPILLELSVLFHKDSPFQSNAWPTNEQAEAWFDLEEYLPGCPVPNFIRKCREWANETGRPADLPPVVYAEAVRQLKYQDTNHDRALGIARAAMRKGA